MSLLGFSLENETLILDDLFYLYNENVVDRKLVRMLVSYFLGFKISDLVTIYDVSNFSGPPKT